MLQNVIYNVSSTIQAKDFPKFVSALNKELCLPTIYRREITESICSYWLYVLADITLLIRKGFFPNLRENVDKLKDKINSIYDKLLDNRCGKINMKAIIYEEKKKRVKESNKEDFYYSEDY